MPTQRYYSNGKRIPSVTMILGKFKDPGALMWWSHDCANQVLLEAIHVIETFTPEKARKFLQSEPLQRADFRNTSQKAATAGTIAHNLVELWIHADEEERHNLSRITAMGIRSRQPCTIEIAKQSLRSFQAFLSWIETSRFELYETEVPLVSEKYRFGGTLDCNGFLGNDFILLDWKTSKSIYADYVLQLAAYKILWEENWNPPVSACHLLQFSKETGDFHHIQFTDLSLAEAAFLRFRENYDAMKEIEESV